MSTFEDLLRSRGIVVPSLIADGKYHSCDLDRPRGKGKASYLLSSDGGYGRCINWTDGREYDFWYKSENRTENNRKYEAQRKRDNEIARQKQKEVHEKSKVKTLELWNTAEDAATHPYLLAKNVQSYGLKQVGPDLLIPVQSPHGELMGLQKISMEGKYFTVGTEKRGNYYTIGDAITDKICICEGYATGASIFEATGYTTIVAFDCGNLLPVSRNIANKYPDKRIIICADNDHKTEKNPGATAASEAAKAINAWVSICPTTVGTDYNDLHQEQGINAVLVSIESAGPEIKPTNTKLKRLEFFELMQMDIKAQEWILPWMPTQSLNMIHARAGVGKTHVALGMIYAIATGGQFLGWQATKPRKCLYIDGEMPINTIHDRLFKIAKSNDTIIDPGMLYLITPDAQEGAMPDLSTQEGQAETDELVGDCEVIVVDNLSCLCRGEGSENDAESWLPVQAWALKHRKAGRSIVFIHHSSKGGTQRGTSKKEDILDNILNLKVPLDVEEKDGAIFEVFFEKHRHVSGDVIRPFQAQLVSGGDRQYWEYKDSREVLRDKVERLASQGMKQINIARELGVNQSTVSRYMNKGKDENKNMHAYSSAYSENKDEDAKF